MVPAAPRYDSRLLEAIAALDDRAVPIAEVNRRVGRVARELGFVKPSYVHVRRLVVERRLDEDAALARRAELRAIALDVVTDHLVGRFVHPYEVADRVAAARAGRFVAQSHKPRSGYPEPP